jgi:hypothetical protein
VVRRTFDAGLMFQVEHVRFPYVENDLASGFASSETYRGARKDLCKVRAARAGRHAGAMRYPMVIAESGGTGPVPRRDGLISASDAGVAAYRWSSPSCGDTHNRHQQTWTLSDAWTLGALRAGP